MNPEVRIYCNEPSHETKVAKIETYQRTEPGKWRAMDNAGSAARNWKRKQEGKPPAKHIGAEVKTAEAIDPDEWRTVRWSRHRLACPLCDLTAVVQAERFSPILDALAENGVEEVSLRAIGAMVR